MLGWFCKIGLCENYTNGHIPSCGYGIFSLLTTINIYFPKKEVLFKWAMRSIKLCESSKTHFLKKVLNYILSFFSKFIQNMFCCCKTRFLFQKFELNLSFTSWKKTVSIFNVCTWDFISMAFLWPKLCKVCKKRRKCEK